jgi:hypothetical protein
MRAFRRRCVSSERRYQRRYLHPNPGSALGRSRRRSHAARPACADETIVLPSADGRSTIIEASAPRTNASPPSPPLSDRERLRAQVRAQRETVIIEAPVSPNEAAHVIGRVTRVSLTNLMRTKSNESWRDLVKDAHNEN